MAKDTDKVRLRAFSIYTRSNILREEHYVVIASTYQEAEDIYWNELNGYHEILKIELIPCYKVAFRQKEQYSND